jgi:hypothetical protein
MDSIQITTGEICLSVNGDESRVIRFNPKDVLFAEKFYRMLGEAERKSAEYQRRAEELDASNETDDNGLPVNIEKRLAFLRETCDTLRQMIDDVFGAGTSQTAFGDAMDLDAFGQFLNGISPYFQKDRAAKMAAYLPSQKPARGTGRKRTKRK